MVYFFSHWKKRCVFSLNFYTSIINSDLPMRIDSTQALKLRSLGLIEFKGNDVQCLCNLYRFYFQERI
ncbi:AAA-like domain-containing protein [Anabaena sp. AL93]|uniref:AAA-like domain-containing protein n=1 Tax=Anabaena sp. AL93 TaxID=1678133 RepID=UPI0025BA4F2D|nr:AAA-like domain-containing protein [Anabaena sp. AL93]MCX5983431.1 AAA-like domain-containing protein [Nostocales cyanobacterium LacPavin_0920_SED1_MAG_38_18]